ncbi:HDIG domain-containing protein [Humidesulfovibrio mexicanus]|uniref:HDIG domain-containing protein n=1 Tax=Humidesulfovibrio mexicanus TaxID=147047 RepID=A0A239AT42_9BACT|nr:HD domain-containing phosphohydrolase [Humidesulfovibrio mexicanus]SNR98492.1 HDIG domain-containing protein [Humidesulfovibrio mexicanus]
MTQQHCPGDANGRDRVLLVDDDRNLLDSLRRVLGAEYELFTAEDGQEALGALAVCGPFTVIVADFKMPGMDGIELLSRVARANPDTVRILLTGHADLQTAIDAANKGSVYRFLTKPCPPELLRQSIDAAREHAHLLRDQRELFALKRCKVLLEGIVRGFSTLVEARDPYLAGHQQRVTALSLAMGREMGLTGAELETLRIAGLLHDIGKVYVPADFLNRPGILRQEELSVIQMHPEVGYDILKHLDEDWPVAVIIRQHHERMDGSGYPQGLDGRFIVKGARILAVADVVDAMCSHRPYRPSLGIAAALNEIEKNRGRLYDEQAADACLMLFRERAYRLKDGGESGRPDDVAPLYNGDEYD